MTAVLESVDVPMMALGRVYQRYRSEFDAAWQRVMERGTYVLGSEVEAFEEEFSAWCDPGRPVVSVASGTDAVLLALRSLGIGPGDHVATVSHTAVATVAAIELAGAVPILIDIEPRTFTIDVQKLEDTLNQLQSGPSRPKVRAVVPVHLYGHPCDIDGLLGVCERYGVQLLEDCAQAHGASFKGRKVGSFGAAAAFSFYPTKNLGAFGDGGAITFSDERHAQTCRALRQYGWRERYFSDLAGFNSRLDELQAALLRVRMRHIDEEIEVRRKIAARYNHDLREFLEVPFLRAQCEHAYHLYVIRHAEREKLRARASSRGVSTAIHYPAPVHMQRAYAGRLRIGAGGLDATERAAREVLSIPMHPFLTDIEVESVIRGLRADERSSV